MLVLCKLCNKTRKGNILVNICCRHVYTPSLLPSSARVSHKVDINVALIPSKLSRETTWKREMSRRWWHDASLIALSYRWLRLKLQSIWCECDCQVSFPAIVWDKFSVMLEYNFRSSIEVLVLKKQWYRKELYLDDCIKTLFWGNITNLYVKRTIRDISPWDCNERTPHPLKGRPLFLCDPPS